ncbi:MAG: DUF4388 domain-containing protein [wastewater metagenome]|nr:DUF4388 domain-containing protein [Candidatus Loosdrechtia aerotolerans]
MNPEYLLQQAAHSRQVHLIDCFNIIRKHKWVVIIFFLVVVSAVTAVTFSATPVYKATAQIIIERRSLFTSGMVNVANMDPYDQNYHQTQYNLLMSRSLARRVIEDLDLAEGFAALPNTSSHESADISGSSETQIPSYIVNWYLSNLEIVPLPGTHLLDINYLNSSPEMAARIVNAHAHAFIERNAQRQRLVSFRTLDWLKTQLLAQKMKVGTSQQAIYEYKYQQLKSFSPGDESIFSLPELMESYVIQDLRRRLSEFQALRLEMSTKYGPKYPKIVEVDANIRRLEQKLTDEVYRIRDSIKMELDRIVALEETARKNQHSLQQMSASPEKAINYNLLHLEAENDQTMYDILLKHLKEISLTGDMERDNIRIVDEAELPLFPTKPRVFLNISLAVILGLTFGTGLAFFLEYMDKTVKTPKDIMQHLGLSVLGMVPYDRSLKRNKMLALPPGDSCGSGNSFKDSYYKYDVSYGLIAKLPLMQSRASGQVFLVESTIAGEGKSTVLAKSAISLAKGVLRVIMVDADLQRPSLHYLFGLENGRGESGLINAMEGILSQGLKKGSLHEYSIDDLFSLIALKKQSGQLVITNDTQSMSAIFENGRLFHMQNQVISNTNQPPSTNRLGSILIREGIITESQLKDALERNQRTGQPLGYILINAGYINQSQLQRPLKLQIEERLQKLFSWKQGTFAFKPGRVETYEDKRIYFEEDYVPLINRLGALAGSRLIEKEVLSYAKSVHESNLTLLPAGTGGGNVKLDGPLYYTLLSKFLTILKQHYDVVLVDGPPFQEAASSVTPLLPLVDGVIFVIKAGKASIESIHRATTHIKSVNSNIIGVVLNQTKTGYNDLS